MSRALRRRYGHTNLTGSGAVMTRDEAAVYVRSIRNKHKRAYAERWLSYRFDGGPRPQPTGLSFMGSQAVRLAMGYPEIEPPGLKTGG